MNEQDEAAYLTALAAVLEEVKSGAMTVDEALERLCPKEGHKGRGRPPGTRQKTPTLGGIQAAEFIRLIHAGNGPNVAAQLVADAHDMVASSIYHAVKRHAVKRGEVEILWAQLKAVMDKNLNRLVLRLIPIAVLLRKDSPSMEKLMAAVIEAWQAEVAEEIEQIPLVGPPAARGLLGKS